MLKIKNDFNTVRWWQFPMLIVAGIVNATGVALFLLPSGVLDGGLSGTAILLSKITPLHVSLFLVILKRPVFPFRYFQTGSCNSSLFFGRHPLLFGHDVGVSDGVGADSQNVGACRSGRFSLFHIRRHNFWTRFGADYPFRRRNGRRRGPWRCCSQKK